MDFQPPPTGLEHWLSCAFWLMGITLAAVALVKVIRGKPGQPPNEQLQVVHEGLTERVAKLEDWKETVPEKLEAQKREILAEEDKHTIALHSRINEILSAVSNQAGVLEGFKASIAEIQNNIREIRRNRKS